MAKTMARLDYNTVINLESWPDNAAETDTLLYIGDKPVGIGDVYADGKWYRGGTEILSPLEEAQKRIEELEAQNAEQAAALEAIYMGVTE